MNITAEQSLLAAARAMLVKHEGYRLKVYADTKGIPTIGIGFNMEAAGARELIEKCGGDYHKLVTGEASLTDAQVEWLFEQTAIEAIENVQKVFPGLGTFSVNRQRALVDMMFNLGPSRFGAFRGMISAIERGNWQTAAIEALDSLWAKQVSGRAHEDAALLAEG